MPFLLGANIIGFALLVMLGKPWYFGIVGNIWSMLRLNINDVGLVWYFLRPGI